MIQTVEQSDIIQIHICSIIEPEEKEKQQHHDKPLRGVVRYYTQ